METLEDLKREIVLLDDLRIALQVSQQFPDIGGNVDIILSDMQRVNSRIAELLNPNEGGMLVSEMVETPQIGDWCVFWDDDIEKSELGTFTSYKYEGYFLDAVYLTYENCKVIKKANGTDTSNT